MKRAKEHTPTCPAWYDFSRCTCGYEVTDLAPATSASSENDSVVAARNTKEFGETR